MKIFQKLLRRKKKKKRIKNKRRKQMSIWKIWRKIMLSRKGKKKKYYLDNINNGKQHNSLKITMFRIRICRFMISHWIKDKITNIFHHNSKSSSLEKELLQLSRTSLQQILIFLQHHPLSFTTRLSQECLQWSNLKNNLAKTKGI